MEKQQIGLITSVVVNVVLAVLLIFFIFRLNASSGVAEAPGTSAESKALLAPGLGCVKVGPKDALIVIDVQNDFMPERPYTAANPRHPPMLTGTNLQAGSLPVSTSKDIVAHINPLIETFEAAQGTIIYSLDWHSGGHCSHVTPPDFTPVAINTPGICRDDTSIKLLNEGKLNRWPVHCIQGSWGAQFDPHLKISTAASSFVVKKGFWQQFDSYSAFGGRLSKFTPANDATIVDADANWEDMTQATKRLTDVLKERKITRAFIVGIATNYCVKHSIEDALIAAFTELPGLAIATVKEAVAAVGEDDNDAAAQTQDLFKTWQGRGVAVLGEKNKDGKPLFNTKC